MGEQHAQNLASSNLFPLHPQRRADQGASSDDLRAWGKETNTDDR